MKLPRFTLRELFLLVVIAAMGCGWWVERRRLNQHWHDRLVSEIIAWEEHYLDLHRALHKTGQEAHWDGTKWVVSPITANP